MRQFHYLLSLNDYRYFLGDGWLYSSCLSRKAEGTYAGVSVGILFSALKPVTKPNLGLRQELQIFNLVVPI